MNVDPKLLMIKITSTFSMEADPTDDTDSTVVRKRAKYRHLTCRELLDWEIQIPEEHRY
jgi:hypothetical protein